MSILLDTLAGSANGTAEGETSIVTRDYPTATAALAAWTPDVTRIWVSNPNTIDGDQELTHDDLEGLAKEEAQTTRPEVSDG